MNYRDILSKIEHLNSCDVIIYGAHNIARQFIHILRKEHLADRIDCIVVTNKVGNASEVDGISVYELNEISVSGKYVVVATPSQFFDEIKELLMDKNTNEVVLWNENYTKEVLWEEPKTIYERITDGRFRLQDDPFDETYYDFVCKDTETNDNLAVPCHYKVEMFAGVPFDEDTTTILKSFNYVHDYERELGQYVHIKNIRLGRQNDVRSQFDIYVIKSHHDKTLTEAEGNKDLIPVQAGAALTNITKCRFKDSEGDSISLRNETMAEMTAIYAIWKNTKPNSYKGVCHYRRQFLVDKNDLAKIIENDIDVVLAVPRYVLPNVYGAFLRNALICEGDKEILLDILKNDWNEYYEVAIKHLSQSLFYPCNMMIAKDNIFNDYCEFVFDVLLKFDDYFIVHNIPRNKKYTAYWAEIISSIYYVKHREDYKIALADFKLFK